MEFDDYGSLGWVPGREHDDRGQRQAGECHCEHYRDFPSCRFHDHTMPGGPRKAQSIS